MSSSASKKNLTCIDLQANKSFSNEAFLKAVLKGLSQTSKTLPFEYLYDATGSHIFEEITHMKEYYLTACELNIIETHAHEMSDYFQETCFFIELGSGSSKKARSLIDVLLRSGKKITFIPIDISKQFLFEAAHHMHQQYHHTMPIIALAADFVTGLEWISQQYPKEQCVIYFPGSTIGNFSPEKEGSALLTTIRQHMKPQDLLLLSTDLIKKQDILSKAYNDPQGITLRFIFNLLNRINHELQGNFHKEHFHYQTEYNPKKFRMELSLKSLITQEVRLQNKRFTFQKHEHIMIEYSYKYDEANLKQLTSKTGLHFMKMWTDPQKYFGMNLLQKSP